MANKGLKKLNKILRERNKLRQSHGRAGFVAPTEELARLRQRNELPPLTPLQQDMLRIQRDLYAGEFDEHGNRTPLGQILNGI